MLVSDYVAFNQNIISSVSHLVCDHISTEDNMVILSYSIREAFIKKKKCNIFYTRVWPPPYFPESVTKI